MIQAGCQVCHSRWLLVSRRPIFHNCGGFVCFLFSNLLQTRQGRGLASKAFCNQ
jgi:hypothetical protein